MSSVPGGANTALRLERSQKVTESVGLDLQAGYAPCAGTTAARNLPNGPPGGNIVAGGQPSGGCRIKGNLIAIGSLDRSTVKTRFVRPIILNENCFYGR